MIPTELYRQALTKWGIGFQSMKACEEAGELVQAICKVLNGKWPKERLTDEIADIEIMTEQLKYAYQISEDVEKKKQYKLKRLEKKFSNG